MLIVWSKTPSKEERTYEWDVQDTDWSKFPEGKSLRSKVFSCGGIDGLFVDFHPKGKTGQIVQTNGWATLTLRRNTGGLWVKCKVSIDDVVETQDCLWDPCQYISHINMMPSRDAYSKITVEVMAVKRMCKPEDVVLVACKPGDVLRVTESISTAAGVSAAYS